MRFQKIFSGEENRKFFEYEVVLSMNEKVLELIIKQYEQCRTPGVVAAIQEQDKLSRIMRDKKAEFYKYTDQSVEFLRIGTEKFFEILTPRLGVFISFDKLAQMFFAKSYTLLFSSYTHTSTPLADLLVDEFMCRLTK